MNKKIKKKDKDLVIELTEELKLKNNKIEELENKIKELKNDLELKSNKIQEYDRKVNELNQEIDNKNNLINILREDEIKDKVIQLLEEIKLKNKEMNELKSNIPFQLLKDEKLMTIIFNSVDQRIHHSFICKNTDPFSKIEKLLYDKYPEYKETENFFLINGKKINRFKTFDENKIKDSDIITLNQIDD